jgi:cell division septation protein DedD
MRHTSLDESFWRSAAQALASGESLDDVDPSLVGVSHLLQRIHEDASREPGLRLGLITLGGTEHERALGLVIAALLAGRGCRTLLLDLDFTDDTWSRFLGAEELEGIVDHVLYGLAPERLVRRTSWEALSLLPGGSLSLGQYAILSSTKARNCIDVVSRDHDLVCLGLAFDESMDWGTGVTAGMNRALLIGSAGDELAFELAIPKIVPRVELLSTLDAAPLGRWRSPLAATLPVLPKAAGDIARQPAGPVSAPSFPPQARSAAPGRARLASDMSFFADELPAQGLPREGRHVSRESLTEGDASLRRESFVKGESPVRDELPGADESLTRDDVPEPRESRYSAEPSVGPLFPPSSPQVPADHEGHAGIEPSDLEASDLESSDLESSDLGSSDLGSSGLGAREPEETSRDIDRRVDGDEDEDLSLFATSRPPASTTPDSEAAADVAFLSRMEAGEEPPPGVHPKLRGAGGQKPVEWPPSMESPQRSEPDELAPDPKREEPAFPRPARRPTQPARWRRTQSRSPWDRWEEEDKPYTWGSDEDEEQPQGPPLSTAGGVREPGGRWMSTLVAIVLCLFLGAGAFWYWRSNQQIPEGEFTFVDGSAPATNVDPAVRVEQEAKDAGPASISERAASDEVTQPPGAAPTQATTAEDERAPADEGRRASDEQRDQKESESSADGRLADETERTEGAEPAGREAERAGREGQDGVREGQDAGGEANTGREAQEGGREAAQASRTPGREKDVVESGDDDAGRERDPSSTAEAVSDKAEEDTRADEEADDEEAGEGAAAEFEPPDEGPVLAYSVHVGSYQTFDAAQRAAGALRQKGKSAFVVPVLLQEKGQWYRVFMEILEGAPESQASLTAAKREGLVEEGNVRETPWALYLGTFEDRNAAGDMLAKLDSRGISAYTVGSGPVLLYAGAFESAADAELLNRQLRQRGFEATLVRRRAAGGA